MYTFFHIIVCARFKYVYRKILNMNRDFKERPLPRNNIPVSDEDIAILVEGAI